MDGFTNSGELWTNFWAHSTDIDLGYTLSYLVGPAEGFRGSAEGFPSTLTLKMEYEQQ